MSKLVNLLLTLVLAAALLGVWLAVPSASVNEDAADRYMELSYAEEDAD